MAAEESLSEETLAALREMFRRKDKDGTGWLKMDELEECLHICGMSPTAEDLRFFKKHFDENGDGKLQIEELLQNVHVLYAHSLNSKQLMEAFQKIDSNGDGYIRLPELFKILTHNNFMAGGEAQKLMRTLINKYDSDGDGKFNYSEFVTMFQDIPELTELAKIK